MSAYVFTGEDEDISDVEPPSIIEEKVLKSKKRKSLKNAKGSRDEVAPAAATAAATGTGNNDSMDPMQYRMTDKEKQELRQTKTFRRIEADLKERNRRSRKNIEAEAKTKKPSADLLRRSIETDCSRTRRGFERAHHETSGRHFEKQMLS